MFKIGVLCKISVNQSLPCLSPSWELHPAIVLVLKQEFIPYSIYMTNGKFVINNVSSKSWIYNEELNSISSISKLDRLEFTSISSIITKSINSFQQNNIKISNLVHSYVARYLVDSIEHSFKILDSKCETIIAIGGECATYLINYHNCYNKKDGYPKKYITISNSIDIIEDARRNFLKYSIPVNLHLVDYNQFTKFPKIEHSILIIHLAKINISIIKWLISHINKQITNIIFIYCHHDDFKSKTKPLFEIQETPFEKINKIEFPNGDSENVVVVHLQLKV
jgi:hypothetical protein